jgi:hypothetical protein
MEINRKGEIMMATEKQVHVHKWEDRGVGKAPFRVVGFIDMPNAESFGANSEGYNNAMTEAWQLARTFGVRLGSCDVCGTGIRNHYVIQDATGKRFVVGCDCVMKTDDSRLMSETKAMERKRQREIREAKRRYKWELQRHQANAALDAQRQRNGGLTDSEVAERERAAKSVELANQMAEVNGWLIDVLNNVGYSSDFISAMIDKLHEVPVRDFHERLLGVLASIYAKSHGRSGSKKYVAATEEFCRLAGIES